MSMQIVCDACKDAPYRPINTDGGDGWIRVQVGPHCRHACSYDCARQLLGGIEAMLAEKYRAHKAGRS